MGNKFSLREYSLLASLALGCSISANGQLVYTDLDPDLVVGPDDKYLDIDIDGFSDFGILKQYLFTSNTLWECYSTIMFVVECVNPDNSLVGYPIVGLNDIVYALDYGYLVNASAALTPDGVQYATFKFQEVSCLYNEPVSPWYYANIGHWASQLEEDVYIGFKFFTKVEDCPNYGWMRCSISENFEQITIKDYAYNEACGKGVFTGMLVSGIDHSNANGLTASIFSESNYIQISLLIEPSQLICRIYNMSGQVVAEHNIYDTNTTISTSEFHSGIYIVQLFTPDGIEFSKPVTIN